MADSPNNNATGAPGGDTLSDNAMRFIKILQKLPIFKGLTLAQLKKILNVCSHKKFLQGSYLCKSEDESHEVFILIKGELKVVSPTGEELARITPLGIVGEMGIFTGERRSADVMAMTDVITLNFRRNDILRITSQDSDLAAKVFLNVINELSRKIREDNKKIVDLHQGIAPDDNSEDLNAAIDALFSEK